jgi:hypothetical protein
MSARTSAGNAYGSRAKFLGTRFALRHQTIAVSAPLPTSTAFAASSFRDNALTCQEVLGMAT